MGSPEVSKIEAPAHRTYVLMREQSSARKRRGYKLTETKVNPSVKFFKIVASLRKDPTGC